MSIFVRAAVVVCVAVLAASAGSTQPLVYSQLRPFASPTPARGGRFGSAVVVVGDVNGDGRADVAATVPNEGRVLVLSGTDGAVLLSVPPPSGAGEAFGSGALAAPGDLDRDGRPDLVVVSAADGRTYALSSVSGAVLWSSALPPGANAGFGVVAVSASDLDGDGLADLVVGLPYANVGGRPVEQDLGRVYVYSGATGAPVRALVSPNGQRDGGFGAAVATVPDLDGDGRTELMVGAPGESVGSVPGAGRAYVFSGASGALLRTLTAPIPTDQAAFGRALVAVGGLGTDGEYGLVVGAPGEPVAGVFGSEVGRVYAFDASSGAQTLSLTSHVAQNGARFGDVLVAPGDVDGDGRPDLAVGEPGRSRVYVVSGATGRTVQTLTGEGRDGRFSGFGTALAGGGALRQTGGPSLVVGSPRENIGDVDGAGKVYVVSFLPAALSGDAVLTPGNGAESGQFGQTVSVLDDASGDGRPDLVVGAAGESDQDGRTGRVYVMDVARQNLLWATSSPSASASRSFGAAVAGTCDLNGDRSGDVVAGAPREAVADEESNGAYGAGRAYLLSGVDGSVLYSLVSPQAEANGQFGQAVASVGDVDGDGRCDVAVGAPGEFYDTGRTYIFSGATGAVLQTLDSPLVDRNPGSVRVLFGSSVAGVGDVNGDGRPDIAVGAPAAQEETTNTPSEGRAFVLSGADGSLLYQLRAPTPGNYAEFGSALAGVGDVDGDGRPDIAVGAYAYGLSSLGIPGRAYVFSGASGEVIHVLTSPAAQGDEEYDGRYGWSVVGAGDVDGDGRPDIGVSAPGEGGQGPGGGGYGSGQGRTYVHSGADGSVVSTLLSPLADYTPGQFNVQGGFGGALAAADFDGDRLVDLVVGAPSEATGNVERSGRAYAFYGVRPTSAEADRASGGASPVGAPYPNPARAEVTVDVTLAAPGRVRLVAFDVLGRVVADAGETDHPAGTHAVRLSVQGWAPGTYVLRVEVVAGSAREVYSRRSAVVR